MEYLTICPDCRHHGIIETVKAIKPKSERNPQRLAKCLNCKKEKRLTIIGEIIGTASQSKYPNPEYATVNKLVFHLW
jgi:RNase P subunit RPR2